MTDHANDGGTNTKVNTAFWVIGIAALLWNLLGVGNFFFTTNASEATMELMTEAQRADIENMPGWMTAIFGIATISGTLASIALLMKKKWAVMLFLISFVAVLIQMVHGMFTSEVVKQGGAMAYVFPIVVIGVSGLLWFYSRQCDNKGWLN